MAMNGDTLGTAIANAVDALDLTKPPTTQEIWRIVGNEIINHIKNNADIEVNTTHNPSTINVAGTATNQTNPAPVNSSSGSGTIS